MLIAALNRFSRSFILNTPIFVTKEAQPFWLGAFVITVVCCLGNRWIVAVEQGLAHDAADFALACFDAAFKGAADGSSGELGWSTLDRHFSGVHVLVQETNGLSVLQTD